MNSASSFELLGTRHFTTWLAEQDISLAFTTYQAGKLFLIGRKEDGQLSAFERSYPRCLGLWGDGQTLWMTSQFQLWRFENVLASGEMDNGYDRLYVPRLGYTTGDLDAHDITVDHKQRPVFVNTLFSCLATISPRYSFEPVWRPPFISRLAAEDRCHLNGLAMAPAANAEKGVDGPWLPPGTPCYVTACSQSDVVDGWRDHRSAGGCVIDVNTGDTVAEGLSMPHSPRLKHNRLWLLNSGNGDFGFVDLKSGTLSR